MAAMLGAVISCPRSLTAEMAVRYREGLGRGFMTLSSLEGKILADGEQVQTVRGNLVTTRLVFRFRDGSIHDETTVFSQQETLTLVSDHLVQKGPSFKQAIDVSVTASTGQVTGHYTDSDGKDKPIADRLQLPADVGNGIVVTLLKNLPATVTSVTVPMVATSAKPRLVNLEISSVGENTFVVGGFTKRKARHFVVKVKIGGLAGTVAPLVGKQPADTHVWVLEGPAPAFVRSEGPLYQGGPSWRIEATAPHWLAERR